MLRSPDYKVARYTSKRLQARAQAHFFFSSSSPESRNASETLKNEITKSWEDALKMSGEFLTDFGRLLFLNDDTNYWFLYYQYLLLLAIFSFFKVELTKDGFVG
jgi:hypothetical protein